MTKGIQTPDETRRTQSNHSFAVNALCSLCALCELCVPSMPQEKMKHKAL